MYWDRCFCIWDRWVWLMLPPLMWLPVQLRLDKAPAPTQHPWPLRGHPVLSKGRAFEETVAQAAANIRRLGHFNELFLKSDASHSATNSTR